jgi:hypothetical protein
MKVHLSTRRTEEERARALHAPGRTDGLSLGVHRTLPRGHRASGPPPSGRAPGNPHRKDLPTARKEHVLENGPMSAELAAQPEVFELLHSIGIFGYLRY